MNNKILEFLETYKIYQVLEAYPNILMKCMRVKGIR